MRTHEIGRKSTRPAASSQSYQKNKSINSQNAISTHPQATAQQNLQQTANQNTPTYQLKPDEALVLANQLLQGKRAENWDEVQGYKYEFTAEQWRQIVTTYNQGIESGVKMRYVYDDSHRAEHVQNVKIALDFKKYAQTGAEMIEYGNTMKTIMLGAIGELTGPAKTAVSIVGMVGAASVIVGSFTNVISADIYKKQMLDHKNDDGTKVQMFFGMSQIINDLAGGIAAITAEHRELKGIVGSEKIGLVSGYFLGANDVLAILKEIHGAYESKEWPRVYPLILKFFRAASTVTPVPVARTVVMGLTSALLARDEASKGGEINVERKRALGKLD